MSILIALALASVLIGAVVVVFTADPARQAVALGVYGLLLTIFFMVMQAPDVALSQLAVGTAVTPLMVLLTVRKVAQSKSKKQKER